MHVFLLLKNLKNRLKIPNELHNAQKNVPGALLKHGTSSPFYLGCAIVLPLAQHND
jgi:hypothetical protein